MPRLRAAHRLFLTYLALIATVVVTLSIGADHLLRRQLTTMAEEQLLRSLALSRSLYDRSASVPADELARHVARLSGHRVTIISPGGRVLADSEVPPERLHTLENHSDRAEVQAAREGAIGMASRESGTLGTRHLYVAQRSDRGEIIRAAVSLAEREAALAQVQRGIYGVGFVALVLAVLFSVGFTLAVMRPLRRIVRVAGGMAAGDLSLRVRMRGGDELAELAGALDSLAAELHRRLGQLEDERAEMKALIDSMAEAVLAIGPTGTVRRANAAARKVFNLPPEPRGMPAEAVARRPEFRRLVMRVLAGDPVPPTELAYGERHLLATAHPLPDGGAVLVLLDVSELRRLEGVRRDFVANVSHELKTPLTAIRGYSETLLDEELPRPLAHRFATVIRSHAERLQRIVDDLLDLSRIESGGWRPHPRTVDIGALAEEAWTDFAPEAAEKGVRFSASVDSGCGSVAADAAALRQVLTNLFTNALRYTGRGGEIAVRCRRAAGPDPGPADDRSPVVPSRLMGGRGWVEVSVRDTGTGIASAHLPRVFERFYRADPARSRAEGGTGLGLAIVRHLVEAHGGGVWAESELGAGTAIRFTLPASADRYGGVTPP